MEPVCMHYVRDTAVSKNMHRPCFWGLIKQININQSLVEKIDINQIDTLLHNITIKRKKWLECKEHDPI